MDKIFQNPNILKLEKSKTQSVKCDDSVALLKYDCAHCNTTPLNSFNKYLVNFTGLNRTISKRAYQSVDSIRNEVATFPNSKGIVGNLPSQWIEKIPKELRAEKIKELYQDFSTTIKDFRKNRCVEETIQKLNSALHKAGVIEDYEELDIEKLGKGVFGAGYHLKGISDDNYMIKIFDYVDDGDFGRDFHGNCPEINRAAYWQKNAGKNTQMIRFYFGDTDAGYMVNKYIDKKGPQCKKYVSPELYGLYSDDVAEKIELNGHNKISGFQIDYGGIMLEDATLNCSKNYRGSFIKFFKAPNEKKIELIQNADIKLKKVFARNIELLSESERAVPFKKLAESPDSELKNLLVDKLEYLRLSERAAPFNQLIENADAELKKILAFMLGILPQSKRFAPFKQLAENADSELKKILARRISCLPDGAEKAECAKLII